ncbi:5fba15a5-a697-4ca6-b875-f21cda532473 [Thermothielavioides terrestris]|uniref:5fba15a5-a697-4ca6-b875-f21cda532473 n=1 Tax=Thermothielavioides terrestris TaxID=2587410 RepID=A0A446BRZ9_9PEZI|nr:5fba15a5-a697-4ca6-b875-f21cda532473 [Thermothielavioides terrestris]
MSDVKVKVEEGSDTNGHGTTTAKIVIDLTGDSEDEAPIKQEEQADPHLQDTDSEYLEDSDHEESGDDSHPRSGPRRKRAAQDQHPGDVEMIRNIEDAQDMLDMLKLEQKMLKMRRKSDGLDRGGVKRLKSLDQRISRVKKRMQGLEAPSLGAQRSKKSKGNASVKTRASAAMGNPEMTAAMASGVTAKKRKPGNQMEKESSQKKGKRGTAVKPGRRGGKAARESVKLILSMLRSNDLMADAQEMADLPILQGIDATTVKDQKKQLQELSSKASKSDMKQMRGDMKMLGDARRWFHRKYDVLGDKYLIKGMKTPLPAYQFAAAGWMVGREKSSEAPQGGLLADSMGLGKTVQTLACICGNPPSKEDKSKGLMTTLVVVPASAVQQWINEIFRHCETIKACHYRLSDGMNDEARETFDIWVTSYEEVLRHYPSDSIIKAREQNKGLSADKCEELRAMYAGPLLHKQFYRVVLDEAHGIKSRTKACVSLQTKHSWALTGTPVQNKTAEIFPYMQFLKVPHSSNFLEFKSRYLRNDGNGELGALLQKTMLKRTMGTKRVEDIVRRFVSADLQNNANSSEDDLIQGAAGTSSPAQDRPGPSEFHDGPQGKNWMILALRLRQAASHPFLLEHLMKTVFGLEDIKWLIERLNADIPGVRIASTPFWRQTRQLGASGKAASTATH